ncbi:unnamed protein product [Sphagnum jensenii]|uniref:Uncharacterized protein n=2 Tax=Sphagnum jensenii TaxID=128206 RepID=A0ABP1B8J4_9BRYO
MLHGSFIEKLKRPGEREATWCIPFVPNLLIEALDEGDHAGSVRWIPGVVVTSFGNVAKERNVPEGQRGLPLPFPWVPREILNKPSFKDPVVGRLLARSPQVLGNFESRPGSLLR